MPLALARKTHRAAACLTAAIACCAACLCAGCTGAATHAAGATRGRSRPLCPDGTLLVSNFDSGQVEAVDVAAVPGAPETAG